LGDKEEGDVKSYGGQAQWYTSIIPATVEVEIKDSLSKKVARPILTRKPDVMGHICNSS
jgi:hypothetical protein